MYPAGARQFDQASLHISDPHTCKRALGDGHLSWAGLFQAQDLGSVICNLLLVVALIITTTVVKEPAQRPLWLYDATISFPNKDNIIPYWAAVVVPLCCMLLSFAVGEWQRRGQRLGWRRGLGAFLHFTLDGVFAFVVTAELTQVFKVLVGRYRPDYLARCNPVAPTDIQIVWAQSAADNPACNPTVGVGELRDGHYSFPSGHTSTVFVFAVYSVVYGVWAFCYRDRAVQVGNNGRLCFGALFRDALFAAGTLLWPLAQLSFAWGVGISRIIDYHHHPSDVVAGSLLGSGIALLYAGRAIARTSHVYHLLAVKAGDLDVLLPSHAESSGGGADRH